MVTLRIEHAIVDYGTWKRAFDRFADRRRASGVRRHRIHRPTDDAHYIFIELDFNTREQAHGFLDFLTDQVWSTPTNAPALVGTPQTRIVDLVDQEP